MLNLICKKQQEVAKEAARTFVTPKTFSTGASASEALVETSYQATGCAGAVVAPSVIQQNVAKLELIVRSPSGAVLLTEERYLTEGKPPRFPALELPQSGRYTVTVRTWAHPQQYEACSKSEKGRGELGKILRKCVASEVRQGFPRMVEIRWRGSAGLKALELGQEWRPVVEPELPATRRLHLDPGVAATIRVQAANRGSLNARVGVARGGPVAEQHFPNGVGSVRLPALNDEQFLILRFELGERATAPVALLVTVDSGARVAATTNAAALDWGARDSAANGRRRLPLAAAQQARIASDSATDGWEFRGSRGDQLLLHIVPSGRAGLVLRATVFSAATEEVLVQRDGIARRTEFPLRLPASGVYIVEVGAMSVSTPDADGRALYTIELKRPPR